MAKHRSYKQLNQIAMDIAQGKVFTSLDIRDVSALLGQVFMPLLFFNKRDRRRLRRRIQTGSTAVFFEYFDQAGPRSINGMPIFTSVLTLSSYEAAYVFHKAVQIEEKMKEMVDA